MSGLTLGIDTSTVVCVGLADGDRVLASEVVGDTRAHAEALMPLVTRVLARAGAEPAALTAIAVGVGPGPFTGLRVGVVAATTMAEVLGLPVRGVCGLDVLAAQAVEGGFVGSGDFLVATDARRGELYWARYDRAGVRASGPSVGKPDTLPALPTFGPGAGVALDAGVLARLAWSLPDAGLNPLYLRRPDAEAPTAHKSTLPGPRLAMGGRR